MSSSIFPYPKYVVGMFAFVGLSCLSHKMTTNQR